MSNEQKWAPGPWEFNYCDGSLVSGPNDIGYVEVKGWFQLGMGEANAHLIAAAPELYEALEALLETCHAEPHGEKERMAARAALAKANGGGER